MIRRWHCRAVWFPRAQKPTTRWRLFRRERPSSLDGRHLTLRGLVMSLSPWSGSASGPGASTALARQHTTTGRRASTRPSGRTATSSAWLSTWRARASTCRLMAASTIPTASSSPPFTAPTTAFLPLLPSATGRSPFSILGIGPSSSPPPTHLSNRWQRLRGMTGSRHGRTTIRRKPSGSWRWKTRGGSWRGGRRGAWCGAGSGTPTASCSTSRLALSRPSSSRRSRTPTA
mmetsp:Transcript_57313/g.117284  ORF Transcript_57313/g.117284 Transcript_57313/m.117284 type:complete len:231 (+) Transcript_57313:228-920(+)